MAPPPMTPSPAGPPCQGTRIGTLCFSAVSPKSLSFGELDDYCANVGMKVPGLAEYRYAMPRAPAGLFPPGASIWMAEAFQYNRNHEEYGSVVVWYSPGSWNSGPVSATAKLPVVCVDRLLTSRTDSGKSYYVGVPKQRVNQLVTTTTQQDAYWCWAAVAQMIWMLRGKVVTQQEIVQRALGDVLGQGISSMQLAQRLSRVGIKAEEDKYVSRREAEVMRYSKEKGWYKPEGFNPLGETGEAETVDSRQLALELDQGTVYILAYGAGANRAHAVLLVGVDVTIEPNDFAGFENIELRRYHHKITIKKYHVVNPWPGKGYQALSPDELQELVKWKVSLSR